MIPPQIREKLAILWAESPTYSIIGLTLGSFILWVSSKLSLLGSLGFRFSLTQNTAGQYVYGYGSKTLKAKNYIVLAHKAPSILTIRDPKKHRPRRHRVTQALSDENIKRLEPGMQEHIGKFCSQMGDEAEVWSPTRDMSKWCNYLLFDMMMSMVFSNPLRLVTDTTFRHIPDVIHQSSRRQSMYLQSMKLALLAYFKLDEPLFPEAVKARDTFVAFLRNVLKTRYKRSLDEDAEPAHDVYAFLKAVSKRSDAEELKPADLNAECATMIIAGSDTTATSLAACLFYLGRYRNVYNLAAEEVRAHFSNVSEIRLGATLNSCTYLRACIQEALRLSPAVGISLPRETPAGGVVVNGSYIPGGMLVGSGIYSIHHKEAHFSDPFTYRPERWLPDRGGAKDLANHDTKAYGPFQIGPRGCLGKGIAMHELMLSMAHIFFRFDFETVTREGKVITVEGSVASPIPGVTELPIQEFVTAQSDGPYVRYRRRNIS
ncbi:cytochrome P450 67 [Thelonectria olida]|uniref:Cytochrome P450 67 n=1 Tax=Thelonectria olida TaxID=1576542 RepID=A0A9P9AHN5_9HYPO|nr:cytochrome P450 67 [Thelonectria olida]